AKIANGVNCACAPSTIVLKWDGSSKWTGRGAMGTCGHDIILSVHCDTTGVLTYQWGIDWSFPDNCGPAFSNLRPDAGFKCPPPDDALNLVFSGMAVNTCCGGIGGSIKVTVTS